MVVVTEARVEDHAVVVAARRDNDEEDDNEEAAPSTLRIGVLKAWFYYIVIPLLLDAWRPHKANRDTWRQAYNAYARALQHDPREIICHKRVIVLTRAMVRLFDACLTDVLQQQDRDPAATKTLLGLAAVTVMPIIIARERFRDVKEWWQDWCLFRALVFVLLVVQPWWCAAGLVLTSAMWVGLHLAMWSVGAHWCVPYLTWPLVGSWFFIQGLAGLTHKLDGLLCFFEAWQGIDVDTMMHADVVHFAACTVVASMRVAAGVCRLPPRRQHEDAEDEDEG